MYTLWGEISNGSGIFGERVAFKSVLATTHLELGPAADDQDVNQLFDFLISVGVGRNTYFDDLAYFQNIFVNG